MKRVVRMTMLAAMAALLAIPASAGLIHRYTLDTDGSDSVATAHLTAFGGPVHATTDGSPAGGGYAVLDGVDDAYRGDNNGFGLLGDYASDTIGHRPFTVVLWARTTATGSRCAFAINTEGASGSDVAYGTYQHTGFFVRSNSSEGSYAGVYARGGGANSQVHGANILDNQWHQVVGVFGHTFRRVYVDGVTQPEWQSDATIPFTTQLPVRFVSLGAFWRRNNQWVDYMPGSLDDVQVYTGALSAEQVAYLYANPGLPVHSADNPYPADGQENVLLTDTLSWTKGSAPSPEKTITGYHVFADFGNAPGDPNLYWIATLDAADTDFGSQAGETLALANGTTYRWRVDQAVNGSGPADANSIPGYEWSFTTAYSIPVISEITPTGVKVDPGQSAQATATYYSAESAVTGVTWYLNGAPLNPATDSNVSVSFDDTQSTLTIVSMSEAYEGQWYCVVTNQGGDSEPSPAADIALKKLLAWYRFEQNGDDAAGDNHGTEVGGAIDYTAGVMTLDGQLYAADPNGSNYLLLSTDAYPKAGYGNGLDEFTVSAWLLEPSQTDNDIYFIGSANTDNRTIFEFGLNGSGNVKSFYRDEDNHSALTESSGLSLRDGQWHYLVVTRAGDTLMIYADGEPVGSNNVSSIDNFGAWEFPLTILADNLRGVVQKNVTGQLDDLRIYNYGWTAQEVAQFNYDLTGSAACLSPVDAKFNLVNTGASYCRVDLADFAELARHWLECGLYPDCQ